MQTVLDTNVLISGIFWKGKPSQILELWMEDKITLIVSKEILDEYCSTLEKISRKLGKEELGQNWIKLIFHNSDFIEPNVDLNLCRDPDDDKFINCAIAGKANLIITGDEDLLELKRVEIINILNPVDALKIILSKS